MSNAIDCVESALIKTEEDGRKLLDETSMMDIFKDLKLQWLDDFMTEVFLPEKKKPYAYDDTMSSSGMDAGEYHVLTFLWSFSLFLMWPCYIFFACKKELSNNQSTKLAKKTHVYWPKKANAIYMRSDLFCPTKDVHKQTTPMMTVFPVTSATLLLETYWMRQRRCCSS